MDLLNIRLVLLDYDLTMVYNVFDFYEAYSNALKHYGGGFISFEEFLTLLNQDKLSTRIPEDVSETDFWVLFRRLYVSRHPLPMDGVRDLLRLLKGLSVKAVVVSGRETSNEYIWRDLRMLGLSEYIDEVYTVCDLKRLNGFEEYLFDKSWLISYILRKHWVSPCNALCIGDFTTDLLSCKKLGIPFIGVNKDDYRGELLRRKGAEIVVKNLFEVIEWIPEIDKRARC
ncbi:MAG: HAD family hydrolase [Desulfurococcus sp.]|uniref:HAD family hydrolase n=1 Tax=Desulfurococcus sp. TaxID=51678 RepID=UPI003D0F01C7